MIKLEGRYTFPKQWQGIVFINPKIDISPIVGEVNPINKTINVYITLIVDSDLILGEFLPDINPVPVDNLNYNEGELGARIIARINHFKVEE